MYNLCVIYKITNTINNKIYIGQTWDPIKKRFAKHCSDKSNCVKLRHAIDYYGKDNFSVNVMIVCNTQKVADYWECFLIEKYEAIKNGYNILPGGKTGSRKGILHSNESKQKMSNSRMGKISPNKGKIGGMKGKKHTEEAKKKISEAQKELRKVIGGPMLGKHHTEESKKKSSLSNKGIHKDKSWKIVNGKRVWSEVV